MSDILKVTTPNTVYENAQRPNNVTVNDPVIQNIADPTKVTRPDGQAAANEQNLGLNYESNFEGFISLLRNMPNITEIFSQIFFQMGTEVSSGIGENFANEISKFMEMMKMSPEQLADFVKAQAQGAVKFNNVFFDALENVLAKTNSMELQREILNFLKIFNDASSSGSTLKNIDSIIKNMSKYMTSNFRGQLSLLAEKLQFENGGHIGENPRNTQILKKEIVPFLSQYVKKTNDLGKVRDMITMLTLNVAKYENGSYDKLVQSYTKLLSFKDFHSVFGGLGDDALLKLFSENKENDFVETFIQIMKKGLSGEGGFETKLVFQNVLNSMLVNQSVYMPLMHFIIPAEIFGNVMFSEIWVDPDDGQPGGGGSDDERRNKLLIKFDIKDLGFFDLIVSQHKGKVEVQLFYPPSLAADEKALKKDIASIVEKNGFSAANVALGRSVKPKTITEVFPKIYERKNGVNVKI